MIPCGIASTNRLNTEIADAISGASDALAAVYENIEAKQDENTNISIPRIIDIVNELKEYGVTPVIADPEADAEEAKRLYGIEFVDMDQITAMDAVVLAVAHEEFKDLEMASVDALFGEGKKILLDLKGLLDRKAYEDAGYCYWRL